MTTILALGNFEQARRKAFWRDWFSRLTGKQNKLLSFDDLSPNLLYARRRYLGQQSVLLDQIIGSEGRYREFDRAFYPRRSYVKERWVSIDKAYYTEVFLLPIELLKIGQSYFVRDGNHRVSVARSRGQEFIDAHVTEIEVTDDSPI